MPGPGITSDLHRPSGNPILAATQPAFRANPDSPNLSYCHRCGVRCTDLGFFPSNWRLIVLCDGCITAINYGDACSSCFSNFTAPDNIVSLKCRFCHLQVHPECILSHQRFRRLPYLDSFTCIDCCPYASNRSSLLTEKTNILEQSLRRLQPAANISQIVVAGSDEHSGRRLQPIPNGSQGLETSIGVPTSHKELGHLLQQPPNCSQNLEIKSGGAESDEQFSRHLQLATDYSQCLLSCLGQQNLKFQSVISEDRVFFKKIKSIMSADGINYRKFDSSCKNDAGWKSDSRSEEPCTRRPKGIADTKECNQKRCLEEPCTRRLKGIADTKECTQKRCLEEPESTFNGKDRYSKKYSRKSQQLKRMLDPEKFGTTRRTQMSSMEHEALYEVSTLRKDYKLS